jgi:hypothetical protein
MHAGMNGLEGGWMKNGIKEVSKIFLALKLK